MATIKITIKDMPNGQVNVVMEPNGMTIAKMVMSGEKTTSAHGVAIAALNAILKEQKLNENNQKIILPKLLS